MTHAVAWALPLSVAAPMLAALWVGAGDLLAFTRSERRVSAVVGAGIVTTALLDVALLIALIAGGAQDVDYGPWIAVGAYEVPLVLRLDGLGVAFASLSALMTIVVARFSRTYLHKEPGFLRFHLLLALFAGGVHLVAYAGAFDLMFAGWEVMGFTSALFIGFFHDRTEPTRSAVRAFATYRLCDAGFLLATVMTHELIGSTRLSVLAGSLHVTALEDSVIAALFLFSALGKSALLPFSGWLPRAMEGPTPSSALFYGSISLHAGLFLVLRVWTTVEASIPVRALAVALGLATAVYATLVSRAHTDAKGNLAHATLAQVGLILAEIGLGFTSLAVWHMFGHAMLRVWQFLRAPNTIHDAHRLGHHDRPAPALAHLAPRAAVALHAAALYRVRLDELLDRALGPVWWLASTLDRLDRRYRALFERETPE
jgi:NADH-quinone oxidoreductase subunit L